MIPKDADRRVRERAQHRCGYCQSPQKYVFGKLEIDHIIPRATGGTDDEDNLWLACRLCNSFKATQTHADDPLTGKRIRLFNPRKQRWQRHFKWNDDGARVIGRTVCGRATVAALQLNNVIAVMVRREWLVEGDHPPNK